MPVKHLVKKNMDFLKKQVNAITGRLSISPSRHSFHPGETVTASVRLKLGNPMSARSLYAWISCTQSLRAKVSREMDTYDYRMEKEIGFPNRKSGG